MAHGFGVEGLGRAVLPYPTRAEYLKRLSDTYRRGKLTPATRRLLGLWFKWTGRP